MKLNTAERLVETHLPNPTSDFSIRASSKAFQILSSNLYENKPLAIVRELSQNAYDSHTMAGKADVPFEIDLPTDLRSDLRVRDFGVGLSHDQIMNLYTTYFDSNKTHTNELVGGLGLGSKTPFAYTDSFTVISTHEGQKNTYNAFIGETGTPQITLISSKKTDSCNGVEIVISIKPNDFVTFQNQLEPALRYFPIKPLINNGGRKVKDVEYIYQHSCLGIRQDGQSRDHYYRQKNHRVILGPIGYKLNPDVLSKELKEKYEALLNCSSFDLFGEIGKIDIHASREGLSYDKNTLAALDELFAKATVILTEYTRTWIQEAETIGEMMCRQVQATLKFGVAHKIFSKQDFNIDLPKGVVTVPQKTWRNKRPQLKGWETVYTFQPNYTGYVTPAFLWIDVNHPNKWLAKNKSVFHGIDNLVILRGQDILDLYPIMDIFGADKIIRLSELEAPFQEIRKTKREKAPPKKYARLRYKDSPDQYGSPSNWNEQDFCLQTDLHAEMDYWIGIRNNEFIFSCAKSKELYDYRTLINMKRSFLGDTPERRLIAIPRSCKHVEKYIGIPTMAEVITAEIRVKLETIDVPKLKAFVEWDYKHDEFAMILQLSWMPAFCKKYPKAPLTTLYTKLLGDSQKHLGFYRRVEANFAELLDDYKPKQAEVTKLMERVKTKYRMLFDMQTIPDFKVLSHYFELTERHR